MATKPRTVVDRVQAFVDANTVTDRTDAFVGLVRWTRHGSNLDDLLCLLEDVKVRRPFQAVVGAMLAGADGTNAFAHAGIPSERGFLAELGERLMNKVLPRPRNDHDLAYLLRRLFRRSTDADRLVRMSPEQLGRLTNTLYPTNHLAASDALTRSFVNGFRLLATWVQAQGLSPKLRKRSRPCDLPDSSFYRIRDASEAVVRAWLAGRVPESEADAWWLECENCHGELIEIQQRIEREGVSTHVVYGIEVIERCLTRMGAMVDIMAAPSGQPSPEAVRRLILALATSVQDDRSVRHLIRWNTHILQRRIVERSGRTGEHYVTSTRAEYRHIWIAAAGGGLLTVGTAAIKTALTPWHVSDFLHGVLYGLNYAVSFLLLQRLGLVLATKQPAMMAAALATIVRERRGTDRSGEVARYAARICRSQLAALLGNVIVVSVASYALVHVWEFALARPFMNHGEAEDIYQHLSPVNSGTIFYAALTGVILWLASVVGGWFDNFCAYNRLSVAIAEHPAGRYLGRARLVRWGDSLVRNGSGWATNISLGFMLGMTPSLGKFFGLPLDVRHVTLNAGILSLASTSLGHRWFGEGAFLLGVAGVGVMFVLNLSVSFILALTTAARAYELPVKDNAELLRGLFRHFRKAPLDFFVPPAAGPRSTPEITVATH